MAFMPSVAREEPGGIPKKQDPALAWASERIQRSWRAVEDLRMRVVDAAHRRLPHPDLGTPNRNENLRSNALGTVSRRPIETAAKRKDAKAWLEDRRVREDSSLPPEISLPSAGQRQSVECFAVLPSAQVRAASSYQLEGQRWSRPADLRKICAQHQIKCGTEIEG